MGNRVKFSYVNLRKQAQPADKHCGLCCHAASSDSSLSLWLLDGPRCHYMKCFYSSLWHIEGRLADASINISVCVAQLTSTFFPFNTSVIHVMNFANVLYNNMRNDEKKSILDFCYPDLEITTSTGTTNTSIGCWYRGWVFNLYS